nr:dockerin type I domain-containing protein [Pirellulaceae bacterium]
MKERETTAGVTGDGKVTPPDVLTLINHINIYAAEPLSSGPDCTGDSRTYLDVTGDDGASRHDVLAVINYLNSQEPASTVRAEGESMAD